MRATGTWSEEPAGRYAHGSAERSTKYDSQSQDRWICL